MAWFPTSSDSKGFSIRLNKDKFDMVNLFISYPNADSDIEIYKSKNRIIISMNNNKTIFVITKSFIDIIDYDEFTTYKITKDQFKVILRDIERILTEIRKFGSKLIIKKENVRFNAS